MTFPFSHSIEQFDGAKTFKIVKTPHLERHTVYIISSYFILPSLFDLNVHYSLKQPFLTSLSTCIDCLNDPVYYLCCIRP